MRVLRVIFVGVVFFALTGISHATVYQFEFFTNNGLYNNDPGVDLLMDVTNGGPIAEFTFYNNSTIDCSITRIFFDDGTILGATQSITNGSSTSFSENFPGPGNLPSGENIDFEATKEFNVGAESPPPNNGVNNVIDSLGAGEWVTLSFELINGGTLASVLSELDNGTLRVGLHVMGFSDGSSEGAVNVPEPTTIALLGFGALALLRKRRA